MCYQGCVYEDWEGECRLCGSRRPCPDANGECPEEDDSWLDILYDEWRDGRMEGRLE